MAAMAVRERKGQLLSFLLSPSHAHFLLPQPQPLTGFSENALLSLPGSSGEQTHPVRWQYGEKREIREAERERKEKGGEVCFK